ncbi:hypothetical protein BDY21DRAFT_370632 [Lineolata rhizophorae]|uniref:Uncharacterized protein n=1 Tax=Lineolata rhizophorae TaxID=578093 RepID=A0A6A6P577_9PEZI|nr:hypothetical protein BDY21DRAFT_370632 [Lineolata rhizophorae]
MHKGKARATDDRTQGQQQFQHTYHIVDRKDVCIGPNSTVDPAYLHALAGSSPRSHSAPVDPQLASSQIAGFSSNMHLAEGLRAYPEQPVIIMLNEAAQDRVPEPDGSWEDNELLGQLTEIPAATVPSPDMEFDDTSAGLRALPILKEAPLISLPSNDMKKRLVQVFFRAMRDITETHDKAGAEALLWFNPSNAKAKYWSNKQILAGCWNLLAG